MNERFEQLLRDYRGLSAVRLEEGNKDEFEKAVEEFSRRAGKALTDDEDEWNNCVAISHNDRSHFFFNNAFYVEFGNTKSFADSMIVVFTQHNGQFVFHRETLASVLQGRFE